MANPIISVIVPIYNSEKYLKECVQSILKQKFEHYEILLIDDGSTDSSPQICDELSLYSTKVKVYHKPNGGVSSARNLGLEKAVGEWITYVDSDDLIHEFYLCDLYKQAVKSSADIVFCDFEFIFENGFSKVQQVYRWDSSKALEGYISSIWTMIWGNIHKHSLYTDYNILSSEGISFNEDFQLMTKLCYYARTISNVSLPLYQYRQHRDSVIHNRSQKTKDDELVVYTDLVNFFKQNSCYNKFEKHISWRILKNLSHDAFDTSKFTFIRNQYTSKKAYVLSNPFLSIWMKILMLSILCRFNVIANIIIYLQKFHNHR